jgi:hypothetical protein
MATQKMMQSKRAEMIELIKAHPGISSAELASRVGINSASKVTTALWQYVRNGKIVTERAEIDGRWMNKHYMADQVPPDAAERITQRIVDASDAIPAVKSPQARNSVFDVPSPHKQQRMTSQPQASSFQTMRRMSTTFACAVTGDGGLVILRDGAIETSLSEVETMKVQACLMKHAAARFFATMS